MSLHVFGIRHHGPGSAASLLQALTALAPDLVLVEGPPEADALLPLVGHPELRPPVAILVYDSAEPRNGLYYPFARFSPEWQAITYANTHGVPVRFCDLPVAHRLAAAPDPDAAADSDTLAEADAAPEPDTDGAADDAADAIRGDPLDWLARAAGQRDGERWWEQLVEHRRAGDDVFAAVHAAMEALREELALPEPVEERRREASMRQQVRAAERAGHQRIAVVCGAWHAPALTRKVPVRDDQALLKGLPRAKLAATWVPWTYGRLAFSSGYGAGITSPGWYDHLWGSRDRDSTAVSISWLTGVARLLREEDLAASTAQVIDAARLAETLAALRGLALPGLRELNEAAESVFWGGGAGDALPMPLRLIHERLVIGERLGEVPAEVPAVPLQQDLAREQKRLRLPAEAAERTLELDLRREIDRDRSRLLHRLHLLDVPWGADQRVHGKRGSFHEHWHLRWQPEFAVRLIEGSVWGNTIAAAAAARARHAATAAAELPQLTALLERVLLAELPDAARWLIARIDEEAARASDLLHLMHALPPLAEVLRYGDVRGTDGGMLRQVVDGLVARIAVGLGAAFASLDDEAAARAVGALGGVHGAVVLLQEGHHRELWRDALLRLADQQGVHGRLVGRVVRLLLDLGAIGPEEAARRMGLALSPVTEASAAGAWIEGFLERSGLVLLHDAALFGILDAWVSTLPADAFTSLLPLLRRTFATFAAGERRGIGELARRQGTRSGVRAAPAAEFAAERAEAVLPLLCTMLGIAPPAEEAA